MSKDFKTLEAKLHAAKQILATANREVKCIEKELCDRFAVFKKGENVKVTRSGKPVKRCYIAGVTFDGKENSYGPETGDPYFTYYVRQKQSSTSYPFVVDVHLSAGDKIEKEKL